MTQPKEQMPDEQDTAYLNIKIWLERALSNSAGHEFIHEEIRRALHHLPIIKPQHRADLVEKMKS